MSLGQAQRALVSHGCHQDPIGGRGTSAVIMGVRRTLGVVTRTGTVVWDVMGALAMSLGPVQWSWMSWGRG